MLPIKSKYKIGKRLGPGVFEQLQTQKFALSEARSKKPRGRGQSDYGRQLIEKQRVRYTYGLNERQLSNYAKKAFEAADPATSLHQALELRVDNVAYRASFLTTRRAARQAVSHGHITVNGRRVTTPSLNLREGDVISIREGSRRSPLFAALADAEERRAIPQWLTVDLSLLQATVSGKPQFTPAETGLDYPTVFEFYSR